MFEVITQHLTAIILGILALLAGIAITIKVVKKTRKDSNQVIQSHNKAGRDIAGRDIKR